VQLVVPRDPGVASLPRRAAAGAIDLLVMGGGLIAVAGAIGLATAKWRGNVQPGWMGRWIEDGDWARPELVAGLTSLQLTGRNWRSPGMRAAGIRRVDARTHGPVSIRSAFVGQLLQTGSQGISRALGQPGTERARVRRLAANDEIERMRASRPNEDPRQLIMDAAAIRQRHGASACTWMLPRMVLHVAVEQLPALSSRHRQTLTERLAGTIVLRDR
jgi:hypothetical protein